MRTRFQDRATVKSKVVSLLARVKWPVESIGWLQIVALGQRLSNKMLSCQP